MRPIKPLTADQQFFFDHAGYSYDPKTQTRAAGRTRCAIDLAAAEDLFLQAARVADVGIDWEHDEIAAQDGGYESTCEQATIWHRTESGGVEYLAALGGVWDAGSKYRRVVRAELAIECALRLRQLLSEHAQ
jgi:hypothetical protein